MRAIRYEQFGGYEQAKLVELPRPVPKDDEVLLAMRTVGCHPLDNTFRSTKHPAATAENRPRVVGQSGVGIVAETNSSLFSIDDRAIVSGGGFRRTVDGTWREFIVVAATALTPAPEGVDDNTAAAVGAGAGYLSGYLPLTAGVRRITHGRGVDVVVDGVGGPVTGLALQIRA
jgi:NADPH2:quinone reductase